MCHYAVIIKSVVTDEICYWASLSKPHTSDRNGMSNRLRIITIKQGNYKFFHRQSKLHEE